MKIDLKVIQFEIKRENKKKKRKELLKRRGESGKARDLAIEADLKNIEESFSSLEAAEKELCLAIEAKSETLKQDKVYLDRERAASVRVAELWLEGNRDRDDLREAVENILEGSILLQDVFLRPSIRTDDIMDEIKAVMLRITPEGAERRIQEARGNYADALENHNIRIAAFKQRYPEFRDC